MCDNGSVEISTWMLLTAITRFGMPFCLKYMINLGCSSFKKFKSTLMYRVLLVAALGTVLLDIFSFSTGIDRIMTG